MNNISYVNAATAYAAALSAAADTYALDVAAAAVVFKTSLAAASSEKPICLQPEEKKDLLHLDVLVKHANDIVNALIVPISIGDTKALMDLVKLLESMPRSDKVISTEQILLGAISKSEWKCENYAYSLSHKLDETLEKSLKTLRGSAEIDWVQDSGKKYHALGKIIEQVL
jgi:hypothetical protein